MLLLVFFLAAVAALLVKFATADGDFTLLSKGPAKREQVEGKVVWITGASRGIGEILAKQFANLGAKVILSARNKMELERVKNEITSKHPASRIEVLPLDLASGEDSLREVVKEAESLFSGTGVDFMIHNAAFERPKRNTLEETEKGLQAAFHINVLGTIALTHLLAPSMLERGRGHFVVMSSAAGKCPSPGQAIYSSSKHALHGYFHTLRSELCSKGIKVTVVCPGPIETPRLSGAGSSGQSGSSEPILLVMYLAQYMPTIAYWFLDRVGANRLDAAARKGNTYSWKLFFGQKKLA